MNKNKTSGFTLVEIAVALIIYSLIVSTLIVSLRYYIKEVRYEENIRKVELLIENVGIMAGRYPCPANPLYNINSPSFGLEDCSLTPVLGQRDVDGTAGNDPVLIGIFPIQTLVDFIEDSPVTIDNNLLDTNDVIDAYGNYITYAITQSLTNANTYNTENGAIDIVDEFGITYSNPQGAVLATVISHGPNGLGAFNPDNGPTVRFKGNCATDASPSEEHNCNNDSVFANALRNDTESDYFDDTVRYLGRAAINLWTSGTTTLNDSFIFNVNQDFVGIGTNAPSSDLHVIGDAQAIRARSDRFCDRATGGAVCLSATDFAGAYNPAANMVCDNANEAIVSIGRGPGLDNTLGTPDDVLTPHVRCAIVNFTPPTFPFSCPDPVNQVMVGITNLGNAVCVARP